MRMFAVFLYVSLSEFHTQSFLNLFSDRLLDAVDLGICESLVHGSVGNSVAMALLLCLGVSEFVNEFHLN